MTAVGDGSLVRAKSHGFSAPLVISSVLALLVGVGATIAVSRVVSRPATVATTHASAQYLPPASVQPQVAPDFTLPDQAGQSVSLSSLRGKEVLITFMDPQCTAQCPIMGQQLGSVEKSLPAGVRPVLLVVSVAAGRSAADVTTFTSHVSWQPGWHWLLGNQAQLQAVWAMYHVAVQPTSGDVLHDQSLYVVNPQGLISVAYNAPLPIGEVATAITTHSSR
ncbi:MAG TPA: SCO family protein [Candidatus Deferrimicrobium sp.]|nr:SCO family protein [Candidatus Deferrimicrobium sp.]